MPKLLVQKGTNKERVGTIIRETPFLGEQQMSDTRFCAPNLAHPIHRANPEHIARATIAQPKLDGWARVMVHVENYRTVEAHSRRGRSMIDESRLEWLKDLTWPVERVILDCEAVQGTGLSWGQASAEDAQDRRNGETHLVVLDICQIGALTAEQVMAQSFSDRRELMECLFKAKMPERIGMIPQTTDIDALWEKFVVEMKGEGIMLKDPDAPYASGKRVWTMLKRKMEYTIDVVVTGVTTTPTYGGSYKRWEAAVTYGYWNPKTESFDTIGQGCVFGSVAELEKHVGRVMELWSNGIMADGGLRFAHLIRWRDDKEAKETTEVGMN